jgi:aspartate-semialdehyde dehydrogenase
MANGYTKEEIKMINETKKILNNWDLKITATTVRVPVFYGHSESINVEFEEQFDISDIVTTLKNTPGIIVQDDILNNIYPMPITAQGHDEVFVGRIRKDESVENGINIWVVADNIRKGAATNAIQIMEKLMGKEK